MARQVKILKLESIDKISKKSLDDKLHLDREDLILSEEHYGYYILAELTESTKQNNPRIYLSLQRQKKYYKEKLSLGHKWYRRVPKKAKNHILDINANFNVLIKSIIEQVFFKKHSYPLSISILSGIGVLIKILSEKQDFRNDISEITQNDIVEIYEYMKNYKKINIVDIKHLDILFSAINMSIPKVKIKIIKKELIDKCKKTQNFQSNVNRAIPSSVLYQLEKYIKKEYQELKRVYDQRNSYFQEYEINSFMSIENILKTLFDYYDNKTIDKRSSFKDLLLLKLKHDYHIDAYILFNTNLELKKMDEEELASRLKNIDRLRALCVGGKNINIKNEKHAFYWHLEFFPLFPYDKSLNQKYAGFKNNCIKAIRGWINKYFNVSINELNKKIFPINHDMYPLFLMLLVKTGVNQDVLKKISIKVESKGNYSLDADDLGLFSVVDLVKNKSNTNVTITLKNDSLEKKYTDLYIKMYKDMYKYSENLKLFQYINNNGGSSEKYQEVDHSFLVNIKNSPSSFYKKYEILNIDGERLNAIEHATIRKSHNYQDFLNGKEEFERQIRKTHKSGDTTKIYYENQNFEWMEAKKHKIAIAQDLIVDIFKGKVTREVHKTAGLFETGPLADCENNKYPTFDNAPEMKKNEHCTDWFKCLTCNKSNVIPKVHGPVIFAWIEYMDEQRAEFIREEDWQKEYQLEYESAKETIMHFNKEEELYCLSESQKHRSFVRMKFSKIYKEKENRYAS